MNMLMKLTGPGRMLWCVLFSVYACFWGLVGNGLTLRIGLAVPFAFLGHVLWLKKRYVPSVLMFLLSATFHKTSVVYPLFLFLSQRINMENKNYDLYGGAVVMSYLSTAVGATRAAVHGHPLMGRKQR